MRLLRAILLALLLASAVAAAGCGSESPAERQRARLEDSLIDAANSALDDEGAYSTAVTAACDRGSSTASCDVGITAGTTAAYEDRFRVTVGADGCWRAVRRGLVAADGLDAEHAPPRVLKGCVA